MIGRQDDLPSPSLPVDDMDNISLYLDVVEQGPGALYDELHALYRE